MFLLENMQELPVRVTLYHSKSAEVSMCPGRKFSQLVNMKLVYLQSLIYLHWCFLHKNICMLLIETYSCCSYLSSVFCCWLLPRDNDNCIFMFPVLQTNAVRNSSSHSFCLNHSTHKSYSIVFMIITFWGFIYKKYKYFIISEKQETV